MKTAEPKSSTSTVLQRKPNAAPLFQPEGQRDDFFGPKASANEPFFSPATPPIQAKCAACEQEDKVQKKDEQEEVQPKIQPKLKIGAPDDHYEKQADAVADKVVQRLASPAPASAPAGDAEEKLQRKEDEVDKTEEQVQMKPIFDSASPPDENAVQRKCTDCEQEETAKVQRKESGSETSAAPDISSRLQSSKGGGSPLPDNTRSQMESAMGADFSGVRVHTGSEAAGMSQDIQAQAFTHGSDVYFNEGKYSPESSEGQHLLAHELTHAVQQGASEPAAVSRKIDTNLIQREVEAAPIKPRGPIDITNGFDPSPEWRAWIKAQKKNSQIPVEVKAGNNYAGTLYLSRSNQGTKGDAQDYTLTTSDGYGHKQFLEISNIPIFEEFRSKGITPVVVIEAWKKGQPVIKGYLSVKTSKGTALAGVKGFIESFSSNLEKLGYLGIKTPKIPTVENTFEQGRLTMKTTSPMTTVVAGYLNASMSLGIINSVMTFEVNATIDIKGIANGQLDLRRDESGGFGGKVLIQAQIQNVAAELTAEYIKTAEGADVTVQGKGKINSEKFQGEVGFIVAQQAKADALMKAQLGVQSIEAESQKAKKPTKPAPNSRGNMALVGWGTVNAAITPWLQGMAKIGIDSKGQVTIVGEITVPGDVKLMEERGKKVTLFKIEVKGGYGIPVIGQVGLFASVELFINAGFGPLVLKNVGFTGTYSTDPTVLQNFKITGTLGINAFAVLGLAAEAGVFLTLIGHDIKAGLNVTAAAGLRAYAEATPTFEYVEQAAPTGGKIGESWLRGHFEAAAQLFLQLSGEFFVSVDSPWWSPLGDERWAYPLGQVTYPIGDSLGIGGDMAWKVGSPDVPELKLSPVEFDPDKFTADVMADPPPGKGKGGDKNEKGEWVDGEGGGDKQAVPDTKPGGPGLDGKKKKEDFTKLPDEQRFLRACDELGQMAKKSQAQPSTYKVMEAKAKQIKAKYAIEEVTLKGDKKGDKLKVYVKHKDRDNKKKESIEVHLMTEGERLKLLEKAAKEFEIKLNEKTNQNNSISRKDAEILAQTIKTAHFVVEDVTVLDGGTIWNFNVDYGDMSKVWLGRTKAEDNSRQHNLASLNGKSEEFSMNGMTHNLYLVIKGELVEIEMASSFRGRLKTKIVNAIKQLENSNNQHKSEGLKYLKDSLIKLKDIEDDVRAIIKRVHIEDKTMAQINKELSDIATFMKLIGEVLQIKDLVDIGHLSVYVTPNHQLNLDHPNFKGLSLGEAIRKKLYGGWNSKAIKWRDDRLTTIYSPTYGFKGAVGLKYIHNGETYFVSQLSGEEKNPDVKTRDINGNVIELIKFERKSIDHVSPAVSEHWNSRGNNDIQSLRESFYNDTSNLEIISNSKNSEMGGENYKPDVGEKFRGPGE